MGKMKVCDACGTTHSDDLEQCPRCGSALRKRTVSDAVNTLFENHAVKGEGVVPCPRCGAKVRLDGPQGVCPVCGHEVVGPERDTVMRSRKE
jgi:rRNA maturation endonuclease Nob1